jgi:hypothetical protein
MKWLDALAVFFLLVRNTVIVLLLRAYEHGMSAVTTLKNEWPLLSYVLDKIVTMALAFTASYIYNTHIYIQKNHWTATKKITRGLI